MALVLALALAAPIPAVKGPDLYFPVRDGAKGVMHVTLGWRTYEVATTVTGVEAAAGGHRVTVETTRDGRPSSTAAYLVSGRGIFRVTPAGTTGEPVALLKVPVRAGDTWAVEEPAAGGRVIRTAYTAGAAEVVEVPAGTFAAVPVSAVIAYPTGTRKREKAWYAVGVGVVRLERVYEDGSLTMTHELKAFTPGK